MWYNLYKSLKIVKRYYIWIVRIFLMDWKRCILIFDSDWLKKKKMRICLVGKSIIILF